MGANHVPAEREKKGPKNIGEWGFNRETSERFIETEVNMDRARSRESWSKSGPEKVLHGKLPGFLIFIDRENKKQIAQIYRDARDCEARYGCSSN